MIMIETLNGEEINLNKNEVLRYLGYGKNQADERVIERIDELFQKIRQGISLKACYEKYVLQQTDEIISFGLVKTESKALKKNLDGCTEVMVFVATIGIGVDRLLGKFSATSPLDAIICQAIGATLIEEWCDILCRKISESEGVAMTPRFSPGYGDFPLESQKEIFGMLDAQRKIGVTLTESLQMMPSKSVSAVMGLSDKELVCSTKPCETCEKTDCQYRR